jgi:DNA (cytosine-5)-methyltransferase 1
MQIVDLYSGIGGFSLAGSWIPDWRTIQFCEIDKFCQKVLSYHFPNVPIHEDIKTLTSEIVKSSKLYNENEKTIVTAGVPCQPWSLAGRRKGTEDVRNLWPETIAFVKDFQPDYCLFENVYGLVNWNGGVVFEQVCADLENAGYEVQTYLLPACSVNAPHRRDRIWIVAHSVSDANGLRSKRGLDLEGDLLGKRKGGKKANGFNNVHKTGITPDTTSNAKSRQNRKDVEVEGGRETPNEQVNGGQFKTIQYERLDDVSRHIANTNSKGLEGGTGSRIQEGKERSGETSISSEFTRNVRIDWSTFPTVPPLCRGDDGIPTGLDFKTVFAGIPFPRKPITFGKWRNESIKCLGNSIVPEVAYQLLKSIDNYEKIHR